MTPPPRIAVVGAGLIGQRHCALLQRQGMLAAVVDPSVQAAAFAADLGVACVPHLEPFLEQGQADAVIIATPNQLHAANGLACVAKGLPILIEKPITDTAESGARLVAAAEQAAVPLLVGHHRRHNPLIAAAKQAIDTGQLGRVSLVNAQFWLYKPDGYFDVAWRRQSGAGPVFINLIHDIDLLRHLCGEITQVTARQSSASRGFEVEDTAVILLEFANGALGTVSVSDSVVAPWSWEFASGENPAYPKTAVPSYMIGGTQGALSIPDMGLWSQPDGRGWWNPIAQRDVPYEAADPLERQLAHFVQVIAGEADPLVSGREGLRTLAVVEAIKRAAETGRPQIPAFA